MRGATNHAGCSAIYRAVSTHAPRAGRDKSGVGRPGDFQRFNPRAPCGARLQGDTAYLVEQGVSTHAPRAGRDLRAATRKGRCGKLVSTHAPRAGRDSTKPTTPAASSRFNPRAPCGARHIYTERVRYDKDVSTHAPRAGRDNYCFIVTPFTKVSTHAPRAGRDPIRSILFMATEMFQPTRPVRGATPARMQGRIRSGGFQPTRPVRGATQSTLPSNTATRRFNPRAPCGARRVRGFDECGRCGVSTHAPRAGRDGAAIGALGVLMSFNPRAPCGARRGVDGPFLLLFVSTHAPRAGRD